MDGASLITTNWLICWGHGQPSLEGVSGDLKTRGQLLQDHAVGEATNSLTTSVVLVPKPFATVYFEFLSSQLCIIFQTVILWPISLLLACAFPYSPSVIAVTGTRALKLPLARASLSALGNHLVWPSLTLLGWAPRSLPGKLDVRELSSPWSIYLF